MAGAPDPLLFDPHVHTEASYDASGSVEAVLSRAESVGLDAVAITDHDTTVGAREACRVADEYDVTVVPGVEVTTDSGHLLALGVRDRPAVNTPFADTVEWVRDSGGVAIVPHPFQVTRHGVRKRDLADCDGLEVFNAWAMTGIQNRRARAYADARGYPQVGASDAHDPRMVGRGHTEVHAGVDSDHLTPATVLDAFREGETCAVGRQTPTRKYVGKYTKAVGLQVLQHVR
jgi:predicted metal-dependent phosphoesterase TrpH